MDLQKISLEPIRSKVVAILGYGNQGRAHALNLQDSGGTVIVGARPGNGFEQARRDGFLPLSFGDAAAQADVVMFLLPDQVIPEVYENLAPLLRGERKVIGFAHGFAYQYGKIPRFPECGYFLVGPKGAGAILREKYRFGGGLPGVFAVAEGASPEVRDLCLSYAKGIGCAGSCLIETTFQEETECDLFGEQTVLCGGIMQLMEAAFETLVRNGLSPQMAFFECCFEARMILELWMKYGPTGLSEKISPTAFYGGLTRGRRLVTEETRAELERIFQEVRSGKFAEEWMAEVAKGMPELANERERLRHTQLQATFDELHPQLA